MEEKKKKIKKIISIRTHAGIQFAHGAYQSVTVGKEIDSAEPTPIGILITKGDRAMIIGSGNIISCEVTIE